MNIKEQIEEWKKVKDKISIWPWCANFTFNKNHELKELSICSESNLQEIQMNEDDVRFLAFIPQNYDQAMQALEEAAKVLQWFKEENDVYDWLEKWGFE